MRSRKHAVESRMPGVLPLPGGGEARRPLLLDPLVDNLSHLLSGFGFRQVVLPASPPSGPASPPAFSGTRAGGPFAGIAGMYQSRNDPAAGQVAKWFCIAPAAASYELGVFIFGEESSLAHAQLISAVVETFGQLGLLELAVEVSSRGCAACQKIYGQVLADELADLPAFRPRAGLGGTRLCDNCAKHLPHNLPGVWSCPNGSCHGALENSAQQMIDFLDEPCRQMLMDLLETVDALEIPYVLSPFLPGRFPGEKILFAVKGGEAPIGRGGTYSGLMEGGLSAIGFSADLEVIGALLPEERAAASVRPVEVFVVALGAAAGSCALRLFRQLHAAGILVAEGGLGRSGIRGQLKAATDARSEIALIIGQKEAMDETVILRDIRSGMQEVFVWDRIIDEVKKRLGK